MCIAISYNIYYRFMINLHLHLHMILYPVVRIRFGLCTLLTAGGCQLLYSSQCLTNSIVCSQLDACVLCHVLMCSRYFFLAWDTELTTCAWYVTSNLYNIVLN